MEKAAEVEFKAREKRLMDAVQLKTPDRVPISLGLNYFPAKFTGTTTWAAYYDLANMETGLHQSRPLCTARQAARRPESVGERAGSPRRQTAPLAGTRRVPLPHAPVRRRGIHEGG